MTDSEDIRKIAVIKKIAVIDTIHDFGKDDMIDNSFIRDFITKNSSYLTKPITRTSRTSLSASTRRPRISQPIYKYSEIKKMKNLEDILLEEITGFKETETNVHDIENINKDVFQGLPDGKINFGIIIKDISNPNLLSFIVNIISKSTQSSSNRNMFTADANNIPEKLVCDIKDNGQQPLIKSSLTNATIYDKGYIPKLHAECSRENYTDVFQNNIHNLFSIAGIETAVNKDNLLQIKLKDPNNGSDKTINIVKKKFIENQDSNIGKFATLFSRIIKNFDDNNVYSGGSGDTYSLPTTNRKRKRDFIINIDELLAHVQNTYGINLNDFTDNNAYINALFDLKRSGDQLQVHSAKQLQTPFISNDRVAIAYSYLLDNPTIRTSVHKQKDGSGSQLKGGKKVVFYNFNKQDAMDVFDNKIYYQNTFNSYINTIDRYLNFIEHFDTIDYEFSSNLKRKQVIDLIKKIENGEYKYLNNHIKLNEYAKPLNEGFTSSILTTQQHIGNKVYVLINVLLELIIYVNNIIIIIQDDVLKKGIYEIKRESYVIQSQEIKKIKDDKEFIQKMRDLINQVKKEKLFSRIKYVDDNSLMKFNFYDKKDIDNNVVNFIKYINNVIYKLNNSKEQIEIFNPKKFNNNNYEYIINFIYDIYLKGIDYNLIDNEYLKTYIYIAKEWIDNIKNVERSARKKKKTSISGVNTFYRYTGDDSFDLKIDLKIPTMYNNETFLSKIFNELSNLKDDNYLTNYDPRSTQVGGETPNQIPNQIPNEIPNEISRKSQSSPSYIQPLPKKKKVSAKSQELLKSNSSTNTLISSLIDYKRQKISDDIYDIIINSISKTNFLIKSKKDLENKSDFVQILLIFIIYSYRNNNEFTKLVTQNLQNLPKLPSRRKTIT